MISLKWKIQAWHALILAIVLGALGVGFYFNERAHRFTQLDAMLDRQIHPLIRASSVLQGRIPPPRRPFDPGHMAQATTSPPSDGWEIDRNAFAPDNVSRLPETDMRDQSGPFKTVEWRFKDLGFYCIVWDTRSGDLIYRSEHAPETEAPMDIDDGYMKRIRDGRYRELFLVNPSTRIIVAVDLAQIYADLNRLKWQIAGVMLAIYAVSVLVGGGLVAHSLSPLKVIQQTTDAIAHGDLKRRIPENGHGNTTELVHLSRDLNDTFGKLDDLFQRQVRFTADASHELRTPLTALISHIKTGRSRPRSVQEHEDILDTCERSARRIQRITEDLLELSRYDSGNFHLERESLSLDQLLASLADDLQPIIAENGSTLRTDFGAATASCDPFRLEQVITNLVNNVLQHNPESITVTLRTRAELGIAYIDVIDDGKSIQPENVDKLFDRFFQESKSRGKSKRTLNIGMGLAISKAIVEAHHGTLTVTSTPGKETKFTISLPDDPGV
jgi:two-component system, OmpR family, sensor kinase